MFNIYYPCIVYLKHLFTLLWSQKIIFKKFRPFWNFNKKVVKTCMCMFLVIRTALLSHMDLWHLGNELFTQRQAQHRSVAPRIAVSSDRWIWCRLLVFITRVKSDSNLHTFNFCPFDELPTGQDLNQWQVCVSVCCFWALKNVIMNVYLHWSCWVLLHFKHKAMKSTFC